MAVNDISGDDKEVIFRQSRSELVDGNTGTRSRFVKKKGVHVVKMYYKKNQCLDDCGCDTKPVFGRPGMP